MNTQLHLNAFAKVNLGLDVVRRREDGYHDVRMIMQSVRLFDRISLSLNPGDGITLSSNLPYLPVDERNLVYVRFASHDPLLEPTPGLKIYEFDPNEGFETFTVAVRRVITEEGRDAFYVFDCLSELQVAWSSDLMMGNFFRVTCPYLFELDTVAYFPVLRGRHSFAAVAKIRDTTQLFIDVYRSPDELFIHPLKVWNRSSATMFLPHSFNIQTGAVSMPRRRRRRAAMRASATSTRGIASSSTRGAHTSRGRSTTRRTCACAT